MDEPAQVRSPDERALQLFRQALEEVGGARALVERRRLDWLAELARAAEVLVLQEEEHRTPEEIADLLELSKTTVEAILSAAQGEQAAAERLMQAPPSADEARADLAGSVVKLAYPPLRR